jgi:hypothetical protein
MKSYRFGAAVAFAAIAAAFGAPARAQADPSPCSLLAPADVEAVLGEPLGTPPFRSEGGTPSTDGSDCSYQTAGFRVITLHVDWTDGGDAFAMINAMSGVVENGGLKGVVVLSDGTELRGAWDEARLFMCCAFYALRGEQLVIVDVGGSRATIPQAAHLADLAVKKLDQPNTVDDASAVAAATEREKARPTVVSVCDLVPRAAAEAIVGTSLSAEPQGSESSCTYAWTPKDGGFDMEMKLTATWRGGFAEMRFALAAIGQATAAMDPEGLLPGATSSGGDAVFDEQAATIIGVMAVRKDVLLGVETGGMMNETALALMKAAAGKF